MQVVHRFRRGGDRSSHPLAPNVSAFLRDGASFMLQLYSYVAKIGSASHRTAVAVLAAAVLRHRFTGMHRRQFARHTRCVRPNDASRRRDAFNGTHCRLSRGTRSVQLLQLPKCEIGAAAEVHRSLAARRERSV